MPLRALLFDLDGVLVHSFEAWFRVVEDAGRLFRGRPITLAEFTPIFGQGTAADIPAFGLACTPAELDRFYAVNLARHSDLVRVDPEAAPLLVALRALGLKLAVVTNTVSAPAVAILSSAGLLDLFDHVACADHVAHSKPAPDLPLAAMAALRVGADEAWLVGDSRFDREAARAAGVRFVGLRLDGDARVERLADLLALVNA